MGNCRDCDATMTCPRCRTRVTLYEARYVSHMGRKAVQGKCPTCRKEWIRVLP